MSSTKRIPHVTKKRRILYDNEPLQFIGFSVRGDGARDGAAVAFKSYGKTSRRKKRPASPISSSRSSRHKRTCRPSSVETDVVVVVGGVQFYEHSSFLCSWSTYFETALHSGMKESTTKCFEFPDRDPSEWELVLELSAPYSKANLTKETVHAVALSWFDELCCESGLEACDNLLVEELRELLAASRQETHTVESLKMYLDKSIFPAMETAFRYNLITYKTVAIEALFDVLMRQADKLGKDHLSKICDFMKDHEVCRKQLWAIMTSHLPNSISVQQKKVLLDNDLLSEMVHLAIYRK